MGLAYVLGNLVGRAMVSFVIVWVGCLLASRLDWRRAFVRSRRWYSVLAVLALTLLGMGSAMVGAGGLR
jgi:apolipoprotein N-acyltransferase